MLERVRFEYINLINSLVPQSNLFLTAFLLGFLWRCWSHWAPSKRFTEAYGTRSQAIYHPWLKRTPPGPSFSLSQWRLQAFYRRPAETPNEGSKPFTGAGDTRLQALYRYPAQTHPVFPKLFIMAIKAPSFLPRHGGLFFLNEKCTPLPSFLPTIPEVNALKHF